jgi:hypothetical protein
MSDTYQITEAKLRKAMKEAYERGWDAGFNNGIEVFAKRSNGWFDLLAKRLPEFKKATSPNEGVG